MRKHILFLGLCLLLSSCLTTQKYSNSNTHYRAVSSAESYNFDAAYRAACTKAMGILSDKIASNVSTNSSNVTKQENVDWNDNYSNTFVSKVYVTSENMFNDVDFVILKSKRMLNGKHYVQVSAEMKKTKR